MEIDDAKWREILTLCFFVDLKNPQKSKVYRELRGSSPLEQIKML